MSNSSGPVDSGEMPEKLLVSPKDLVSDPPGVLSSDILRFLDLIRLRVK